MIQKEKCNGAEGKRVVIIGYKRTPILPMGIPANAIDLGTAAVRALLQEAGTTAHLHDLGKIDALIAGQVGQSPFARNPGKFIARNVGLFDSAWSNAKDQQCASSLDAAEEASMRIRYGHERLIAVVGIEAMQDEPYLVESEARDSRLNRKVRDMSKGPSMIAGLLKQFGFGKHYGPGLLFGWFGEPGLSTSQNFLNPKVGNMIKTAHIESNLAGDTRKELDHIAFLSHALADSQDGRQAHGRDMVPYFVPGHGMIREDGNIRQASTTDELAKLEKGIRELKAQPDSGGLITAANSSNMGALGAALLIASEDMASELGAEILAEIVDFQTVGVDANIMGSGPIMAVEQLFERHGLLDEHGQIKEPERIGHWEVNEAFASVVSAFQKYWGIDWAKLNPFGGSTAQGHPLGATGARCLGLIARQLSLSDYELAVFALCMAGGMGKAVLCRRYEKALNPRWSTTDRRSTQ